MNVIIYTRVSSEEQVEKYGLQAQCDALRGLAARRGFTVVAEAADEGISGTIADRPGLVRVRELLRSGTAEGVLVYDLSRLARETVNGTSASPSWPSCTPSGRWNSSRARPRTPRTARCSTRLRRRSPTA